MVFMMLQFGYLFVPLQLCKCSVQILSCIHEVFDSLLVRSIDFGIVILYYLVI